MTVVNGCAVVLSGFKVSIFILLNLPILELLLCFVFYFFGNKTDTILVFVCISRWWSLMCGFKLPTNQSNKWNKRLRCFVHLYVKKYYKKAMELPRIVQYVFLSKSVLQCWA